MGESQTPLAYAEVQQGSQGQRGLALNDEQLDSSIINGDEEPYTIKCICGYADDDGNTVLCEQCNTWQHIECYYPESVVPDVHNCVDCSPRVLDATSATLRQKQLRDPLKSTDERKAKRPAHKSQKKSRTKEIANVPVQTNGWPITDKDAPSTFDRKRGSPRDQQQPPTKRPKTSHRQSGSGSSQLHESPHPPNHRKRSGSNVANAYSPNTSPPLDLPADYYSPEFIRVHRGDEGFTTASTNLYLDIAVTNLLTNCLADADAFAAATNGRSWSDYLKRYQQPIEELFVPVRKEVKENFT